MRVLKAALLLLVLPVFAFGKDAPPLLKVGEVFRSRNNARVLVVRSPKTVEIRDGGVSAVAPFTANGKKFTVTTSLFGEETRLEFERIEEGIAGPDDMILYPSAGLLARDRIERAKRQLALIGKHLKALEEKQHLRYYSGAAFLLQIRDRLSDEELDVFRGVLEGGDVREKPVAGFRKEIRKVDLVKGLENWCSAYMGPNWKDFPQTRAGKHQRRVWACDRCFQGQPAHNGIVLLWDDLTVEFVPIGKILGADTFEGIIQVGRNSPDERLRTMTYFPPR
ncbi:MAG: hypothetical protein ABFS86_11530 [Planctomycetota bacterium]